MSTDMAGKAFSNLKGGIRFELEADLDRREIVSVTKARVIDNTWVALFSPKSRFAQPMRCDPCSATSDPPKSSNPGPNLHRFVVSRYCGRGSAMAVVFVGEVVVGLGEGVGSLGELFTAGIIGAAV